jgi:predicted acyl esterase
MPWHPEPLPLADPDPRAKSFMVPMRDGTRLSTDIYLTEASSAPVILVRTCYDKASWLTFLPLVAEYVNARGYALVAQDVRGKGRSEGASDPFVSEIDDGYDTLEWVSMQGWCEGKIAMFGDSYFAYTAWAALASGHPSIGAMVSRGIATDIAREVVYRDGTFLYATNAFWAPFWLDNYLYDVVPPLDWSARPLSEVIGHWLPGRRSDFFEAVRNAPPGDPFWEQPCFSRVRDVDVSIPVLHVGGWWEDFHRGQLADWRRARAAGHARQYLLMDATDHFDAQLAPDEAPLADFRETEEGIRDYLPRYLDPALAFLDSELRHLPVPRLPAVRVEVAEAGWWEGEQWPPPGSERMRLHLASVPAAVRDADGGALTHDEPDASESVTWEHDPQDLVPSLDEVPFRDLLGTLPDESLVEARPDVLTFTSEPVDRPLDLVGPVHVCLRVSAEAPLMHIAVKLIDVFPNGRARRIADAALTQRTPSGPTTLALADVAYRVRSGHRLRLEVAASCFPRYLPVIDPETDSWNATTGPRVGYTLQSSPGEASFIDLTFASGLSYGE